ncbi:MAG: hypothetical protein ACYTG6_18040 [Planctomycetota bacterium]|jgi:hypothetical protein
MMPAEMLVGGRVLPFLLVLGACSATTSYRYPQDLNNPNYVKRSKAVREFVAKKDESRLPRAFELLMDDEAHIRALAHEAIRDMMPNGEDFGYRPYLSESVRAGIVARWQAWWLAGATAGAKDLG